MVFWSMDDLNEDGYPGVDVNHNRVHRSPYMWWTDDHDVSNEEMYTLDVRKNLSIWK